MARDPYTNRNALAEQALVKAGHRSARTESLAGGYYGVHVPLEGGYHLSIAQDPDAHGMPWLARVEHGPHREAIHDMDRDVEFGTVHPRKLPELMHTQMKPGGEIHAQISEHMRATRNLGRQFNGPR